MFGAKFEFNFLPLIIDLFQSLLCLFGCCSLSGVFTKETPSVQSVGVRNGVPGVKTCGLDGVRMSDANELIDEVELLREHVVKTENKNIKSM